MNQISLDINKAGQIINEPVVLRVGEKDQTITVNLLEDGRPYTNFTTATFNANKPSGSIVANDPANINNGTITYTVPQALVTEFGKITNAYFLIDGKTSTESFVIAVLQGVNISDDLGDYIPGMGNLNVIYDKWKAKLQTITDELTGIDAPKEVKNVIDNELKNYTNQINDLKNRLTTLQTDVNNLKVPEISGVNLLLNSDFSEGSEGLKYFNKHNAQFEGNTIAVEKDKDGQNILHIHSDGVHPTGLYNDTPLKKATGDTIGPNDYWVISAYAKGKGTLTSFHLENSSNKSFATIDIDSDDWKFIENSGKLLNFGGAFTVYFQGEDLYLKFLQVEKGNVPTGRSLAPESYVKTIDTNGWQKQKITSDNGSFDKALFSSDGIGLKEFLTSFPMGFHTFYCQDGTKDNPDGGSIRGYLHITNTLDSGTLIGTGFMTNNSTGASWAIAVNFVSVDDYANGIKFVKLVQSGQTITATDDTGKTVKLKITGIS